MSAQVVETTKKNGEVYVSVNLNGVRAKFDDIDYAFRWLRIMKELYEADRINVLVRRIVLTACKEFKYESCFAM